MSAYMVNCDHIDGLLTLARLSDSMIWRTDTETLDTGTGFGHIRRPSYPEYLTLVGRMLLAENAESVAHRYEEDRDPAALLYEFRPVSERLDTVDGLKMLACYEYQACEHECWETSEAKRFCDSLRRALIGRLPGFSNAPWEFTRRWGQERDAKLDREVRERIAARRRQAA